MQVLFWLSSVVMVIGEIFLYKGFVNVYYKSYNGGPQSSSGSIIYQLIGMTIIIVAGFILYFTNYIKIATLIMCAPIVIVLLYIVFIGIISRRKMN